MQIPNPFEEIASRLNRIELFLLDLKRVGTLSPQQNVAEQPERLNVASAVAHLKEQGYTITRSQLYKLTAQNKIPYFKLNTRLAFSRKELTKWVESQIVNPNDTSENDLALARSARRKKKGGKQYA
ncbi:hypothetical protein ACFS7Z_24870 [Pontibacter toksunensis]|uniref:Helix-turn-helix domain-containing protein n=1 Tax=Pontibacter toksunensis TaxID=1332631 RepID=A0ABW6C2Y1_9BACT